jgi:hypothetical protein
MICVVHQDPGQAVEQGQVCPGCTQRIRRHLADILDLYMRLDLRPGSSAGQPRVSGSREAPLPLRVDALDLTMPARGGTVHDQRGDQIGHVPVASILDQWVDDWREHRARGERRPEPPTVAVLVGWLDVRLDDACQDHPAIDEFAAGMRQLRADLRREVGDVDPGPRRRAWPCPGCGQLALVADEDHVRCAVCEWAGRPVVDERIAALNVTHCGCGAVLLDPNARRRRPNG